jgi:hypothetical protein
VLSHPLGAAPDFLTLHDELVASAPDELSTAVSLGLDPLTSYGRPVFSRIGAMPYADWRRDADPGFPPGRLHYWKAGWLRGLTDSAIMTLLEHLQAMPSSFSEIGLQHMGGAAARVARRPRHSPTAPSSTTS